MATTIPIPDNPQHVQNLSSIALLKAQGFEGMDASLAESLFEYGMAWRELPDEWLIIYRHPSVRGAFDRVTVPKAMDVQREYDWVRWKAFLEYIGSSLSEWLALPLPHKLSDLVSYYGTEEIFGSSYWEGFQIEE